MSTNQVLQHLEGKEVPVTVEMMRVGKTFLELVRYETQSDSSSDERPTTPGQTVLLDVIQKQMEELGYPVIKCEKGTVIVTIPASNGLEHMAPIGFAGHVDTAPGASGVVNPMIWQYQGGNLALPNNDIVIEPQTEAEEDIKSPTLSRLASNGGGMVITSDGTSLLGADDKAGVAAMIEMAVRFHENPQPHRETVLFFCPDEEVGKFGKDLPEDLMKRLLIFITMDGLTLGTLDTASMRICRRMMKMSMESKAGTYDNHVTVTFEGKSGHPGVTPNAWKPALAMAADMVVSLWHAKVEFNEFSGDSSKAKVVISFWDDKTMDKLHELLEERATCHPGVQFVVEAPEKADQPVKHYHHIPLAAQMIIDTHHSFPVTTFRGKDNLAYIIPSECQWKDGVIDLLLSTASLTEDESEEFNGLLDKIIADARKEEPEDMEFQIETPVVCESVASAIQARPELMNPLKAAFEKLGIPCKEQPVAGGTDGGMVNLLFKALVAPNVGTGAELLHDKWEHIAVEDLDKLADWSMLVVDGFNDEALAA